MSEWEKEGVTARAVALFRQGFSATQISKALHQQFKVNVSRNAVIGKMHRLGETAPEKASAPRRIAAAPAKPKEPRPVPQRPPRPTTIAHGQSPPPKEPVKPYVPQVHAPSPRGASATLAELVSCQCCWPVGAATGVDQLFCAEVYPDDGRRQPYCAEHLEASTSLAWKQAKKAGKHTQSELARSLRKFI